MEREDEDEDGGGEKRETEASRGGPREKKYIE